MTYETLRTRRDGRVLYVDFDNPPLNLMTTQMVGELFDLAGSLAFDPETTVVVFGLFGPVNWATVAVLAPATIVGGYVGARFARRLRSDILKLVIVIFGTGIGLYLLVRAFV